jgi:hypothetical protein
MTFFYQLFFWHECENSSISFSLQEPDGNVKILRSFKQYHNLEILFLVRDEIDASICVAIATTLQFR